MSNHFPALIIVAPLIAAFFVSLAGWSNHSRCLPIAVIALTLCLGVAGGMLAMVLKDGVIHYNLAGWRPPVGIGYRVDHLNALILVVIAVVGLANLIATIQSVKTEFGDHIGPFYTLYLLFVTGLFGIVVTGDAFNLFVLLEITSLTGYALIGIGKGQAAPFAALNYVFIGTMGASFYLLGIGYLYMATGSLNMADMAGILPGIYNSTVVFAAFIICFTGLFIKMALFPLHAWMPGAYDSAPSAVSSLIAPLTTKVMIYVMVRFVFSVFTIDFAFHHQHISQVMVWLSVAAIVMGSVLALTQNRLKRMLAYIIVAEVGYMVGGFWLGNRQAVTGSILHLVNDAAMTLCVFLAAGALTDKLKSDRIDGLKGAFAKMPFTMVAMTAGGLSIIGVPPTCGFFSKWYLISGGLQAGHYAYSGALIFSSLINAVLFFRLFEICFFEPAIKPYNTMGREYGGIALNEAPVSAIAVMLVVAAGLVGLGIYSNYIVNEIIQFAIPEQML